MTENFANSNKEGAMAGKIQPGFFPYYTKFCPFAKFVSLQARWSR